MIAVLDSNRGTPRGIFGAAVAAAADVEVRTPEPAACDDAEIALCLDGQSLEVATRAGVPFRGLVLPTFDTRTRGEPADAHAIFIASTDLRTSLPGALRDRAHVIGPIAPVGWFAPQDRAAAQKAAGLDAPVIALPATLLAAHGPTGFLLQLSLAAGKVTWLFDIGLDIEAAAAMRRLIPPHELDAFLFAHGPDAPAHYSLADLVLAAPRSVEATLALAVGAGAITLPDHGGEVAAAALEACGVGSTASSLETLAVAIDAAIARRDVACQAALDLDAAGSAERLIQTASRLAKEDGRVLARGLPAGLERLPKGDVSEGPSEDPSATSNGSDLESKIDAELEALKKRL